MYQKEMLNFKERKAVAKWSSLSLAMQALLPVIDCATSRHLPGGAEIEDESTQLQQAVLDRQFERKHLGFILYV